MRELINARAREVMANLSKDLGEGVVVFGSEHIEYDKYPSGSLALDVILQGGFAANQWHEIVGNESSGKTNLALNCIGENQRLNDEFVSVVVAAEGWDKAWAASCGVDNDRIILVETNMMEDAYDAVVKFADSHAVDAIVIDSYPALTCATEDGKASGESNANRPALITNQFFRKVGKAMRRSLEEGEKPLFGLFINQWREKTGLSFGDPRFTPGGKGKNFSFYTRLDVARDDWLEGGEGKNKDRIGQTVRVTTMKCKSAPQQRRAYYDIYFDKGGPIQPGVINRAKEVALHGALYDLIEKSGNWYQYGDLRVQGKDNFADALREDTATLDRLEREIRQMAYGGK